MIRTTTPKTVLALLATVAMTCCSDPAAEGPTLAGTDGGDAAPDSGDSGLDSVSTDSSDLVDLETGTDPTDEDEPDLPANCAVSARIRADDGEPLVGARVELVGPQHVGGTTDGSGEVAFELLCGSYDGSIAEYFGVGQGLPDLWGWPLEEDVDVARRPTIEWWVEMATVSGTVLDEAGDLVDGSARVEARLERDEISVFNRADVNDADGTYALVLPVRATLPYTVSAAVFSSHTTYLDSSNEIVLVEDVELDFSLTTVTPCLWSGVIRSSESVVFGRATFEIEELARLDVIFNGDGTFEATLPCGSYAVTVSQPTRGDPSRPYLVDFPVSEPIVLDDDDDSGLEIPLVSLSGSITADGGEVEGVRVTAGALLGGSARVEGTTNSGADGRYRVSLPPLTGDYTVSFRVPPGAGLEQPEPVLLTVDAATVHNLALTTIPVCAVEGRVALQNGSGIAGAGVQFSGTTDSVFLNGDLTGAFSGQVNCGTYDVTLFAEATASTPGFDAWTWLDDLALTEAAELDDGIASAEVSGVVRDTVDNTVAGVAVVAATPMGDTWGTATSDDDGSYSLTVVPDDSTDYLFDVIPQGQPYAVQRGVEKRINGDSSLDFSLEPLIPCALAARLETSEGLALADAQIRFAGVRSQDGELVSFTLTADSSGELEESVDCGDFEASIAFVRGPGAIAGDEYPLEADVPNANSWVIDEDFGIEGTVDHVFVLDVARVTGVTETVRGEVVAGVRLDFLVDGGGEVRTWNRVQSDTDGRYALPVVSSAGPDYLITVTPPYEAALPAIELLERIVTDRELNFSW